MSERDGVYRMLEFQFGVVIAIGWMPAVMPWLIHFKWRAVWFWTVVIIIAANAMLPLVLAGSGGDISGEVLA